MPKRDISTNIYTVPHLHLWFAQDKHLSTPLCKCKSWRKSIHHHPSLIHDPTQIHFQTFSLSSLSLYRNSGLSNWNLTLIIICGEISFLTNIVPVTKCIPTNCFQSNRGLLEGDDLLNDRGMLGNKENCSWNIWRLYKKKKKKLLHSKN